MGDGMSNERMEAMPATTRGARDPLIESAGDGGVASSAVMRPEADSLLRSIETTLIEESAALLKLPKDRIDLNAPLMDYGFDSLIFTKLIFRIKETYEIDIPMEALFDVASFAELAERIELVGMAMRERQPESEGETEEEGVI